MPIHRTGDVLVRNVTAHSIASLTVAELTSRLCADGPVRTSRYSRPAGSALPVDQLLRREGRPVPVAPVSCVADALDPPSPEPARRSDLLLPPPEHRSMLAPVSTPYPQTALPETVLPRTARPQTGFPQTGFPRSGFPQTALPETRFPVACLAETTLPLAAVREPAPGMPGPAQLLTSPLVLPPGARWSRRRRPPARRPLAFGAAVAGAAMIVGSVASNALPDSTGQPVSSPPLDSSGVPRAPVGSTGTVTLGAVAQPAAPAPFSVAQPELVVPSINPPPLGARARPLNPGPMIVPASLSAEPAVSSRSTGVSPPVVAPVAAPAPDPQAAPPSGPEESADQPQPGGPETEPPADGSPGSDPGGSGPDNGGPGDSGPGDGGPDGNDSGDGSPGDRGPGDGDWGDRAPDAYTQSAQSADTLDSQADQSAPREHSDHEGGRHRR